MLALYEQGQGEDITNDAWHQPGKLTPVVTTAYDATQQDCTVIAESWG